MHGGDDFSLQRQLLGHGERAPDLSPALQFQETELAGSSSRRAQPGLGRFLEAVRLLRPRRRLQGRPAERHVEVCVSRHGERGEPHLAAFGVREPDDEGRRAAVLPHRG